MRVLFFFPLLLIWNSVFCRDKITIIGVWRDADQGEISLDFLDDAIIYKTTKLTSKIDSSSRQFSFSISSDHRTELHLLNHFIIGVPNDTIFISVEKNSDGTFALNFPKDKEDEGSFFPSLRKVIKRFPTYNFSFENPSAINNYKLEATAHYNSELNFLDTHSSQFLDSGKMIVKKLITASYYADLLSPLTTGKVHKEQLPSEYFEGMNIPLLLNNELFFFRDYILLLRSINDCYYGYPSPKGKYYDSTFVNDRIIIAKSKFSSETRNNLLLFLFDGLVKNGTSKNNTQIKELHGYLISAFKSDADRLKQINEMKLHFDILGNHIPKAILSQKLRATDGSILSLSQVLPKDKTVYIDFWASWCGPCMDEMPAEKKLISELKGGEVEFVFISWDKNTESWKKAMRKININEKHYQLSEGAKSELAKYLNFIDIPHYIVINKTGTLISYDAPRPSIILKDKSKLFSLIK